MQKIKIGLYGVGHLGKIHLRLLKHIPEFEIVGIYDTNAELASQIAEVYNVTKFDCPNALMQNIDAVDIVTPTISHYNIAEQAIKQEKHIFVEKPVVDCHSQLQKLYKMAINAPIKIQAGYVERFNPAYTAAQKYIKNPLYIDAERVSAYPGRGTDVSVILDMMIHDLDVVLHMVQSPVENILATGVPVVSNLPDIANVRLEFANGTVANLSASRVSLKKRRKMRVFQSEGYLSIDFIRQTVGLFKVKQPDQQEKVAPAAVWGNANAMQKAVYVYRPEIKTVNAILTELTHFKNAILNNTSTPVSIKDIRESMELAFAIIKKMQIKKNNMVPV